MLSKYGLFDFFESGTVEVAALTDINWGENGSPNDNHSLIAEGSVLQVKWRDQSVVEKRGGRTKY